MKPFGLFFLKKVVRLLLLFLPIHDLGGIVHLTSQGLILSTLFFPKFHRKVEGGSVVGRGRERDVEREVGWSPKVIRKEK